MTRDEAVAAVKARPKDAGAWLQLGQVLAAEGAKEKARECFERALALNPLLNEAQQGLAALSQPPPPPPSPNLPSWLQGADVIEIPVPFPSSPPPPAPPLIPRSSPSIGREEPIHPAPASAPPLLPATRSAARDILALEIQQYVQQGWRVVSQTETTAQLVKPKQFGCLAPTLFFFMCGVGLILYLIAYASEKDQTMYLEVLPDGTVRRNGRVTAPGSGTGGRVVCANCGYANSAGRTICKRCRNSLEGVAPTSLPRKVGGSGQGKWVLALFLMCAFLGMVGQAVERDGEGSSRSSGRSTSASGSSGTSARTSSSTSAEDDYREFVSTSTNNYQSAAESLAEQFEQFGDDPSLLLDEKWRTRTAVGLGILQGISQGVIDRDPPARFEAFHATYKRGAQKLLEASRLYAQAFDELDPDKMERASDLLAEGSRIIGTLDPGDLR